MHEPGASTNEIRSQVSGGASVERGLLSDWATALQEIEEIDATLGKQKKRGLINSLLNKLQKGGLVNSSPAEKGKETEIQEAVRQELIAKGISIDEVDQLIIKSGRNIWSANELGKPAWEFFERVQQLLGLSTAPPAQEKHPDADIERTVREAINPVDKAIADLESKRPIREEIERAQQDFIALVEKLADMRVLSVWQPTMGQRAQDIGSPIHGGEEKFVSWLREKGIDDEGLEQMERATFILFGRPGEQRIFMNPLVAKEKLIDYESEQMASLPTAEFQGIILDLKGMAAALLRARRRFAAAERGKRAAALQEKQELLRTNSERSTKLIEEMLRTLQQKFNENTLTQTELISAQGELTNFIISATHNEALYQYSQEEGIPPDVRIEDAQAEAQEVLKDKGVSEEDARKLLIVRRVGGKFHIFAPAYLYESTGLDNQTKAAVNAFTAEVKLAQQTLGDLSEKLRERGGTRPEPAKITHAPVPVSSPAPVEAQPEEAKTPEERIRELEGENAKVRREFELRTQVRPAIQYQKGIEFGRSQMQEEVERRGKIITQQAKRIGEIEQQLAGKVVREKNEIEQIDAEKARLFGLDNRFEEVYNEEYQYFLRRTKDEKQAKALAINVLQQMERDMNKNKK